MCDDISQASTSAKQHASILAQEGLQAKEPHFCFPRNKLAKLSDPKLFIGGTVRE